MIGGLPRPEGMTAPSHRVVCARCRRPEVVCYCRHVTPLRTRTRVVILQHPRERDVPINTARIASLCLPDAELHVGVGFRGLPGQEAHAARPAALLYPGPGAIDIEANPPAGPITLVVLDGTWWQAKKLVASNPWLRALPRYAFRPPAPSDYRIRREPEEAYVSTIEALVHVLGVLEGDPNGFSSMLAPFRAMVDAQLEFRARTGGSPRPRPVRTRAPRDPRARLPRPFHDADVDLVCVNGEANSWPFGTPERRAGADELLHWVACRVSTGETFERIVRPSGAIAPETPRHTEIAREAFERGVSQRELASAFGAWLRPTDRVCTWGTYAADLFVSAGGDLGPSRVDLRKTMHEYANARLGALDDYVRHARIDAGAPLAHGRAGRRLAQMVALARLLRSPSTTP